MISPRFRPRPLHTARAEQIKQPRVVCLGVPNPKQKQFFSSTSRVTGYGGARGGGKSWSIQMLCVSLAMEYKGLSCCICRKTLKDVKDNHYAALLHIARNVLPSGMMTWRASESTFAFSNGSTISFAFYGTDSDSVRWQGKAFDVICIDEATQMKEEWFQTIMMTNRTSVTYADSRVFSPQMFLTFNPGGIGHEWVKRLFIERDFHNNENPDDYTFIQATLDDNTYLNEHSPQYRQALESLPEVLRRAMLYGDWDVFEGQFFPEFQRDTHVVKPFAIPSGWQRYCCFDYGFDMFAAYFIAVDYDGRAYVYKEIAEGKDFGDGHDGVIISAAAKMLTQEQDYILCLSTYAPPDMWNRRQDSGRSAADIFAEHRVYCTKASNERIQGWADMREWLKLRADGKPSLLVFDTCVNLINSMQLVLHDEKRVDDMADEPHKYTHFPDAIRYFVSGRPTAPERPKQDDYIEDDESFYDDYNDYDGGW